MKCNNRGFTLVELIVAIIIVGILASVAIPRFTTYTHKARASEFPTLLMQIYTAEESLEAEVGKYAELQELDIDVPESKWFKYSIAPNPSWAEGFIATATVVAPGFGGCKGGESASIDQTGAKKGDKNLLKYTKNWP